jgi:hypothetical protein
LLATFLGRLLQDPYSPWLLLEQQQPQQQHLHGPSPTNTVPRAVKDPLKARFEHLTDVMAVRLVHIENSKVATDVFSPSTEPNPLLVDTDSIYNRMPEELRQATFEYMWSIEAIPDVPMDEDSKAYASQLFILEPVLYAGRNPTRLKRRTQLTGGPPSSSLPPSSSHSSSVSRLNDGAVVDAVDFDSYLFASWKQVRNQKTAAMAAENQAKQWAEEAMERVRENENREQHQKQTKLEISPETSDSRQKAAAIAIENQARQWAAESRERVRENENRKQRQKQTKLEIPSETSDIRDDNALPGAKRFVDVLKKHTGERDWLNNFTSNLQWLLDVSRSFCIDLRVRLYSAMFTHDVMSERERAVLLQTCLSELSGFLKHMKTHPALYTLLALTVGGTPYLALYHPTKTSFLEHANELMNPIVLVLHDLEAQLLLRSMVLSMRWKALLLPDNQM